MLSKVLKKEYIKLNVECNNWESAIREAGKILLDKKVVTNEFIEETIRSVKELGPYIVIAKGVALPHITSKIGINETGVSLLTLKEPLEFGNSQNNPVKYVFMFATIDMDSHLEALSALSNLLEKPEFFEVMKNATNEEEIIEYIKKEEQK